MARPGEWEGERLERLKTLADGTRTGDELATIFGVSRSAIAGIMSRKGKALGMRMTDNPANRKTPRTVEPISRGKLGPGKRGNGGNTDVAIRARIKGAELKKAGAAAKDQRERIEAAGFEGIPFMEISSQTCKYPLGPLIEPAKEFCGETPRIGSPYCEYHSAICYQPLARR